MRAIYQVTHGEVVPIDGKTLRHSFDTAIGLSPIHMVSAWATHNRLVLGQVKVADKSNEITAIPELRKTLDITGCIITIDAMGCQTAIARQIIEQQADYVLALQANQGLLYADVQLLIDGMIAQNDTALAYYEMHDENHGRFEIRRSWTTSTLDTLRTRHAWHKLQSIGVTEAERTLNGETTIERRYSILSLPSNAKTFGTAVRSHWQIENVVHWVLDIAFREDECRIRMGHGPENFAVLRHIALNLLRQEGTYSGSVKSKRHRAGWNDAYLMRVLQGGG